MRDLLPPNLPVLLGTLRACARVPLTALALALLGSQALAAQAPATERPAAVTHKPAAARPADATHKPARRHIRPAAAHGKPPAARRTPLAPQVAPAAPLWPANEKPAPASVTWDSRGLRIDAANSSLEQILKDVAMATGAKVEGLGADQRVFGGYGPGPARDVLSQLLQGSGYNVLMIGDQGQGAPLEIVLTPRPSGAAPLAIQSAAAADEDLGAEEPPQVSPLAQPGLGFGGHPRNSPEMMREMQDRQQQMQDRQLQAPPTDNPPN